jgi:hypothetical protein
MSPAPRSGAYQIWKCPLRVERLPSSLTRAVLRHLNPWTEDLFTIRKSDEGKEGRQRTIGIRPESVKMDKLSPSAVAASCRALRFRTQPVLSFSVRQLRHPQIALDLFEADDNPVRAYAEYWVPGIVPWASVEVLDRIRIGDGFLARRIQPHGPEARKSIPV